MRSDLLTLSIWTKISDRFDKLYEKLESGHKGTSREKRKEELQQAKDGLKKNCAAVNGATPQPL